MAEGSVAVTHSADETRTLGEAIGRALAPGELILLQGNFGAGKTVLVQGIALGLGIDDPVASPSFVLMVEHIGSGKLVHVDFFRIARADADLIASVEDYLDAGWIVAIEWPDWLPATLAGTATSIRIENIVRQRAAGARHLSLSLGPLRGRQLCEYDSHGAAGVSEVLLAIDTATAWCGVALYDGAVQLELNWRAERHHSEQLMQSIERGLELTGLNREALGALGVSRGPGSYTGVRVGITVARVLSYALDIPIVGVDALDVLAYEHGDRGLPVRPFLDAGRRRYATALYEPQLGGLERVGALQSVDDDSMAGARRRSQLCAAESSALRPVRR